MPATTDRPSASPVRHVLDDFAHATIRHCARGLIGRYGVAEHECPDLIQDLVVGYLASADHYDPARGARTTYVTHVVGNLVASLLRQRLALCRGRGRRHVRCGQPAGGSETASVFHLADPGSEDRRRADDLRLDVDAIVAGLGGTQRAVCRALQVDRATTTRARLRLSGRRFRAIVAELRTAFAPLAPDASLTRRQQPQTDAARVCAP